jgi:hypothetical protein
MATITIPKKITKGEELVIIPRKDYEEFSQWRKVIKFFIPTKAQKRNLKKARQEYKKGNYLTINELKRKLEIKG